MKTCKLCNTIRNENLKVFHNTLPKEIIKILNSYCNCDYCDEIWNLKYHYYKLLTKLTNIKITNKTKYIKIQYAMVKYLDDTNQDKKDFNNSFKMGIRQWNDIFKSEAVRIYLDVIKINRYYYCSHERLKAMDFNIFECGMIFL